MEEIYKRGRGPVGNQGDSEPCRTRGEPGWFRAVQDQRGTRVIQSWCRTRGKPGWSEPMQDQRGTRVIQSWCRTRGKPGWSEPCRTREDQRAQNRVQRQAEKKSIIQRGARSSRQSSVRASFATRGSSAGIDQSKPKMGVQEQRKRALKQGIRGLHHSILSQEEAFGLYG